jgi:hypothetical protein
VDQDLTYRTEQAALGAMITSPQVTARLAYLQPGDFTDLRNQLVYQAVRMLRDSPAPAGESWRDQIARAAGSDGVARSYVDELVAACPDPDPGHGLAYGAMLVQATTYRMAREHASQIDARAAMSRAESSRLAKAGAVGARQAAALGSLLTDAAEAIARQSRSSSSCPPPRSPAPSARTSTVPSRTAVPMR